MRKNIVILLLTFIFFSSLSYIGSLIQDFNFQFLFGMITIVLYSTFLVISAIYLITTYKHLHIGGQLIATVTMYAPAALLYAVIEPISRGIPNGFYQWCSYSDRYNGDCTNFNILVNYLKVNLSLFAIIIILFLLWGIFWQWIAKIYFKKIFESFKSENNDSDQMV